MNCNEIKVSIIVPVYNGEATIARCIDSILQQSLSEIELIIIDDGSTDKTRDICRSYNDYRLQYYQKENGGVSSARNLGISMAHGEYIGFVDADDCIVPEMCEKMYIAGHSTASDICICDYLIVSNTIEKLVYTDLLRSGVFDKTQIQNEVLKNFLGHIDGKGNIAKYDWCVWRRLFRRDFLLANKLLFDVSLSNSEDCLFSFTSTYIANKMVYLKNEYLYTYFINPNSITKKYLKDYWQQRSRIIDELEKVIDLDCSAWDTKTFPLFVMRCVRPSFTNIAYGFSSESVFSSIKQFYDIVHDPRVRKMCCSMTGNGLNDEWGKLFCWCKHKRYFTLYFYYMDVYQKNKLCHAIRRIQKGLERRFHLYWGH